MINIVTIVGIRPDFIRISDVIKRLDECSDINHIVVHTGQHYERHLNRDIFNDLNLRKPDYNLNIGRGKNRSEQLSLISKKLPKLFKKLKLDKRNTLVVFLGDSNTVLGAISLKKEGYKICHIEAGMRSYDDRMPEEINRKLVDHISNLLLVYTNEYKANLLIEGIKDSKIFVTGNTIYEPVSYTLFMNCIVKKERKFCMAEKYIVVDLHRSEIMNSDSYIYLLEFVEKLCNKLECKAYLVEFHRARKFVKEYFKRVKNSKIRVLKKVSFFKFLNLQKNSIAVISDSGTSQEECPILKIPCIVPRDFTERKQSVDVGASILIGEHSEHDLMIFNSVKFIENYKWNKEMVKWLSYGDFKTSKNIVEYILNFMKGYYQ